MILTTALLGLASAVLAAKAAEPKTYTLFHRIFSPSNPPSLTPAWTTRGNIDIAYDGPLPIYAELHSAAKFSSFLEQSIGSRDAQTFYQLALVSGSPAASALPSRVGDIAGQVVAIKACLLEALIPGSYSFDVLGLTLSTNSSSAPIHSFNYDVVGFAKGQDGCPKLPIPRKGGNAGTKDVVTKVTLGVIQEVDAQPSLRTPPRPKADGSTGAQAPPKEKGFLEKYWYYILPILVLMALPSDSGGGGEEPPASAGARRIR